MIEYEENLKNELFDILQETVTIGLGKAASVIGEIVGSHVGLSTAKVYIAEKVKELPMSSERVIIMSVSGDILFGDTIFSMSDDQLIKIIKHIEGLEEIDVDNEEIIDIISDSYQEIGNIILGNVISSMINFFGVSANISVPYIANKDEMKELTDKRLLVVDVVFNIEKLNANGKLYLINDYDSYMKLIKLVYENFYGDE